jgi:hypothetical protein
MVFIPPFDEIYGKPEETKIAKVLSRQAAYRLTEKIGTCCL